MRPSQLEEFQMETEIVPPPFLNVENSSLHIYIYKLAPNKSANKKSSSLCGAKLIRGKYIFII
jgi:hypothetical protein